LTGDEIRAWGWRIPFFIGALLSVILAIPSFFEIKESAGV
jgi:MFS family permease